MPKNVHLPKISSPLQFGARDVGTSGLNFSIQIPLIFCLEQAQNSRGLYGRVYGNRYIFCSICANN